MGIQRETLPLRQKVHSTLDFFLLSGELTLEDFSRDGTFIGGCTSLLGEIHKEHGNGRA
jgi:hypothetical protein